MAWYNHAHRYSALKLVTSEQRHRGEDVDLLAQRDALYQVARADNPGTLFGPTRDWTPPALVLLNQGKPPRGKANSDSEVTCLMRQLP